MSLLWMDSTNSMTESRLSAASSRTRRTGGQVCESFSSVHPSPGHDIAAHGGYFARRHSCLSTTARLGVARGELPHDTSGDFLSRCQSRSDRLWRHRAARAAIWADAGAEPDDVDE